MKEIRAFISKSLNAQGNQRTHTDRQGRSSTQT
jgi:hypothetical protein